MKITYLPLNPDATGFYRCISPGRQLAEQGGHEIRLPFQEERDEKNERWLWRMDLDKLIAREDQPDLYCVQMRWERHWVAGVIHELRAKGVATVIECDDNYLQQPEWNPAFYGNHPYRSNEGYIRNRSMRRTKEQKQAVEAAAGRKVKMSMAANQSSKANRAHGLSMMTQADAVIVSTPHLADIYSAYNRDIHVVRNYVDWDQWEDITPQYEVERERLRLGYLGAYRYRRGDLEVIQDVVARVVKRHPEIDFVANTKEVHDFFHIAEEQRVTIGEWEFYQGASGSIPLGEKTAVMDVGLVPLAPGGFNEGKSHLKGMEYNAAGIPYVASDTESYRYYTRHGVNGHIALSGREWEEQIEHLVTDEQARKEMGRQGRLLAEQNSIQNNWWRWEQQFEGVLGDRFAQTARGAIERGAVQKVSELRSLLIDVERIRPKVVVEVGSARGGTFWALAQVSDPNALLVSIDLPGGSPLDVRDGKDVYTGRDRERFREFVNEGQRCVLIDGNSQTEETLNKLLDTLGCAKIDTLFIDADHRYQGVKRDYELYSPLVREGGLIAFHDVIPQNDPRSGVHVFWNQLKKTRPVSQYVGKDNWGLGQWGGIGVMVA